MNSTAGQVSIDGAATRESGNAPGVRGGHANEEPVYVRTIASLSHKDLKERSVRGGVVTIGAQLLSHAMTVVSVYVLARLLTPEDYGSVAMVVAFTSFLNVFREMGLSAATIQRERISHGQLSALLFINTGLGAVVTLLTILAAPLVASFYGKPELTYITIGLSFCSLFSSVGTQHAALLNRQMRFHALAAVQLSGFAAGLAVAVTVALMGGGPWALVANQLASTFWCTCGYWLASGFRPSVPRKGTEVRELLRFGTRIAAYDVIMYVRSYVDAIMIGRMLGARTLGLYEKAFSLMHVPFASLRYPLSKVAFPAMSALENNPPMFLAYFRKYCSVLAFASMPLVAFMYAFAYPIIRVLLGDRWLGTAELFRILGLATFIDVVGNLRITVMLASGFGDRLVRWSLLVTVAKIFAVAIGLPWGVKGVAIALVIVSYSSFHPFTRFALRGTAVGPSDFYREMARPGVASVAMVAGCAYLLEGLQGGPDLFLLSAGLITSAVIYLAVFAILPGGRAALRDYCGYVAVLRLQPRPSSR